MFWIYFSELCRLIVLYLSSQLLRADGLGVPGGGFPSWAVILDFGFFALHCWCMRVTCESGVPPVLLDSSPLLTPLTSKPQPSQQGSELRSSVLNIYVYTYLCL